MASTFNWEDCFVSEQSGMDEHWLDGEPVDDTDLEPVKLVQNGPTTTWPAKNSSVAIATPKSDVALKA
jgi:hypothetical protein